MTFQFTHEGHGDLTLNTDGTYHNFGYNYHFYLPMMIALAEHQHGRENILNRIKMPEIQGEYKEEHGHPLESILKFSKEFFAKLPMPDEGFNHRVPYELSHFFNGGNNIGYQFSAQKGNTILERENLAEPVVILDGPKSEAFLQSFLECVATANIGPYRGKVKRTLQVIQELYA